MYTSRICIILAITFITVFCPMAPADEPAAKSVPARLPLTYKDSGIYGWWQPYFFECPFDFLITQAIILPGDFGTPGTNNASDIEHIQIWNESLLKARAAGKRVIVVISPGQGEPYTETYYQALEQFLDHVNTEELYAVSLGEENISVPDWVDALGKFYHRIKTKHPDLPVYQWYSCSSRASARPRFSWPLIPADGWLSDEYVATPDDFEQAVRRYRMLGKPFVNIIWASPFYSSSKQTSVPFHQSIFDGHLRVSEKYNVPTAFFCWDGPIGRFWPWDEQGQKENKDLFTIILDTISKSRALPDAAMQDWDDAAKPQATILKQADDGSFAYRENYDLWSGGANEEKPAVDFMSRTLIRGLRHLHWMPEPSRIVANSDAGRSMDASLTSHWRSPASEQLHLTASAAVTVEPGVSPEILFEISPNGYDWIAQTRDIKNGIMTIELPQAGSELHTRLRINGTSDQPEKPLASIDWIEVKGVPAQ